MRRTVKRVVYGTVVAVVGATNVLVAAPAHAEPVCVAIPDKPEDAYIVRVCVDQATNTVDAYAQTPDGLQLTEVHLALPSADQFGIFADVGGGLIEASLSRGTNEVGEDAVTLCLSVGLRPGSEPVEVCRSRALP